MTWQPKYIKRFHECFETSTGVARVLTDAGEGYIKPLGNHAGPHALAREWIGTSVARLLGLLTFDFAIMEVADGDDIPLGHNCKALPGPAFITRKLKDLLEDTVYEILGFIPDQWQVNQGTKLALKEFLCERASFLDDNIHRLISEINEKLLI